MSRALRLVTLGIALLALCQAAGAQGMGDIRINEVLINNTDSYTDDYGHRNSWIELHNTGYSQVNLAGSFLKVIRGADTISYKIPKNDPRTIVAPQGYAVFFADGKGSKGTFYTNFTLDGQGSLMLYDASGRGEPVDAIDFNEEMTPENVSYGWFTGSLDEPEQWMQLPQTTPLSTNDTVEFKPKSQVFAELDESGIVMALTAMSVVFAALVLLYQVFKNVGRVMISRTVKKDKSCSKNAPAADDKTTVPAKCSNEEIPSEVLAAIGAAMYQYEKEMMEQEAIVLTINRVARTYSPWNSKLYGMTNQIKINHK